MRKASKLIITLSLSLLLIPFLGQAAEPLWQGMGRIAISSDGNEHDDDDWSATPFSLAMLAAANLQDKLTLYTYSDHIWGSNQLYPFKAGMSAYDHMHESALRGGEYFGFDSTRFICAVDNAHVAYTAMCEQINLSTEENPLIIIAAGPMQVVGEAIARSNKEALKYVTLLSHSHWNNVHAEECYANKPKHAEAFSWDIHTGWTWTAINARFSKYGLKMVSIKDQNGEDFDSGLYSRIPQYDWVRTSKARSCYKEGSWDWLYTRLEAVVKGPEKDCYDISDAGMVVYLLTGNQDNGAKEVQEILEWPLTKK